MEIVTEKPTDRKSPSAPHTFEDGVEGKVCGGLRFQTRQNSRNCGKWYALDDYPLNHAYYDGHSGTCKYCKKEARKPYIASAETQPPVEVKSLALRPAREYNDAPFCDSTVKAVALIEDGVTKHYLGLRAMCDVLGIDESSQRQRIERNEVLAMGLTTVTITAVDARDREQSVLDSALVPFWLATMDAGRLKDDVRPKVVHFQRIAADVLARYFTGETVAPALPPPMPPLNEGISLDSLDALANSAQTSTVLWQQLAGGLGNVFGTIIELQRHVNVQKDWLDRGAELARNRRIATLICDFYVISPNNLASIDGDRVYIKWGEADVLDDRMGDHRTTNALVDPIVHIRAINGKACEQALSGKMVRAFKSDRLWREKRRDHWDRMPREVYDHLIAWLHSVDGLLTVEKIAGYRLPVGWWSR